MKNVLFSAVAIVGLCSLVGCGAQKAREAEAVARAEAMKQKQITEMNILAAQEAIKEADVAQTACDAARMEATRALLEAKREANILRIQLQEVRKQLEEAKKKSGDN